MIALVAPCRARTKTMNIIIGCLLVTGLVLLGFSLSGGQIIALWQPYELLVIGGASLGAFFAGNSMDVIKRTFAGVLGLLGNSPYNKTMYMELLACLYDLFQKIRKEGLISIEGDVEDPKSSAIFSKYKLILKDHHALDFICDYLRLMVVGDMAAHELGDLMDAELESHHEDALLPAAAMQKVADGYPGFGIVAAVLGIVITMASLGGPPEILGHHVASALVGTLLGILISYGYCAPMSMAMEGRVRDESRFYICIKMSMLACVSGAPPQVAVEFGRKVLFHRDRPTFQELEKRIRGG